jgi:hypothetical protein
MPTTSNFGWTTPADTDLVKDGALAIRTLGNGIDTSFLDLKGGTTGQILSKASNTDLDYTWINNDQGDITEVQAGTGISVASGTGPIPVVTNTVATAFDAKGDLIGGTGADTFSRLAVGTNGQVLTADSTTATGLKWATSSGGSASWSLLNTGGTALTGAQTITVSGISGADKIMLLIDGASSATASSWITFRLNTDTGAKYTYAHADFLAAGTYQTSFLSRGFDTNDVQTYLAKMSGSATSTICGGVILSGCNSSGVKAFNFGAGANDAGSNSQQGLFGYGFYNSTSTISSISLVSTIGNFDAGTIYVYTSA